MGHDKERIVTDITRAEVDTLLYRAEVRSREDREEILTALRGIHESVHELKKDMNGQFRSQSTLLATHQTAIKILEDRGARDMAARWGAAVGGILAVLGAYFGIKG